MISFKKFLIEDQEKVWKLIKALNSGRSFQRNVITNKGLPLKLIIRKGKFDEERFEEFYGSNEMYEVIAYHEEEYVGHADYYDWGSVEGVKVEPKFRRQGVATAIYDFLDSIGLNPQPTDGWMEEDGKAFWKNRKETR